MKATRIILSLFLCAIAWIGFAAPVSISNLQINNGDTYQITFDAQSKITYSTLILKNPDRLVIDLTNAKQNFDPSKIDFTNSPVQSLRTAPQKNNGLRLVFDLRVPSTTKTSLLKPAHSHPYQLLVEFKPQQASPTANTSTADSAAKKNRKIT